MLTALIEWLGAPEQTEIRRSFAAWIRHVLMARLPGVEIPELTDLEEVRSMLAERVTEWTLQWEQQGFEKGIEKGREEGIEKGREEGREEVLETGHAALILELEKRFGPLPEEVRRRVQALDSIQSIVELSARVSTAPSLADLGLS